MTTFSGAVSDFLTGVGIDSTNLGYLTDAVQALTDAPSSWSPAWTASGTAPVVNNGTLTGSYFQAGKFVVASFALTMGSSTTFGTNLYAMSLPVAAAGSTDTQLGGTIQLFDNSTTTTNIAIPVFLTSTTIRMRHHGGTGSVSATAPWTWAQNDRLTGVLYYWTT